MSSSLSLGVFHSLIDDRSIFRIYHHKNKFKIAIKLIIFYRLSYKKSNGCGEITSSICHYRHRDGDILCHYLWLPPGVRQGCAIRRLQWIVSRRFFGDAASRR